MLVDGLVQKHIHATSERPITLVCTLASSQHNLLAMTTVNALLVRKGLMVKSGTIMDATIIAAPSSTKNEDGKREHAKASLRTR